MSDHYILDENNQPQPVDLMTWARYFETADRHVANTELKNGTRVSTVFLGLDHNFTQSGRPILFETMIFGGERDQDMMRYATWSEAMCGHIDIVDELLGENSAGVADDQLANLLRPGTD